MNSKSLKIKWLLNSDRLRPKYNLILTVCDLKLFKSDSLKPENNSILRLWDVTFFRVRLCNIYCCMSMVNSFCKRIVFLFSAAHLCWSTFFESIPPPGWRTPLREVTPLRGTGLVDSQFILHFRCIDIIDIKRLLNLIWFSFQDQKKKRVLCTLSVCRL